MKSLMHLITKNMIAFILCYLTYNALYMLIVLLNSNQHPERAFLQNYLLILTHGFIVMIIPLSLLILVFNVVIGVIKKQLYKLPMGQRMAVITLLGGLLGLVGFVAIKLIISNNIWIIDTPTLLLIAGFCFGFFYSLLSPKLVKA